MLFENQFLDTSSNFGAPKLPSSKLDTTTPAPIEDTSSQEETSQEETVPEETPQEENNEE